jgi:hypothetical protein
MHGWILRPMLACVIALRIRNVTEMYGYPSSINFSWLLVALYHISHTRLVCYIALILVITDTVVYLESVVTNVLSKIIILAFFFDIDV